MEGEIVIGQPVEVVFDFIFFFQAEDGIRDWSVTGVQTCALPISPTVTCRAAGRSGTVGARMSRGVGGRDREAPRCAVRAPAIAALAEDEVRGVSRFRDRKSVV